MRHIYNIIGYVGWQQNTLLQELKALLPNYEILAIDTSFFITPEAEAQAWRALWLAVLQAENSVIVSDGTSENLQMVLDRLWRAPGTDITTVDLATIKQLPNETTAEWLTKQLSKQ